MKLVWQALLVTVLLAAAVSASRHHRFRASLPRAMRAIDRRIHSDSYSRERFLAIPQLPYPYYQRPKYRYPFYDQHGNGHLLYGYGNKRLYSYTQFKPLDGYSKRR